MARVAQKKARRAPPKKKAPPPKKRAGAASRRPARSNGAGGDTLREVEQLLYHQAELLDRREWGEFIPLFAKDGLYWMPASPEQTTGDGVPSIFYEDRDLMTVRMKRVTH